MTEQPGGPGQQVCDITTTSGIPAETRPSLPPAPPGRRDYAWPFVISVWVMLLLAALVYVGRYSSNVPHADDWEIVPALTGHQPITAAWLWSQHNEHRVPLPRLVLLALLYATNNDFRAGMIANVLALGALAFGFMAAVRSARGRSCYTDAFFPLVLLHWGHCENFLWSWQIGFILSTVLAGSVLIIIVMKGAALTWPAAMATGSCLVLLPLCGANGLAWVPALAGWLVILGTARGRHCPRLVLLGSALIPALIGVRYFAGYKQACLHAPGPGLGSTLATSLQFLSVGFGPIPPAFWYLWGMAILALVLITLLISLGILARASWQQPLERPRILGLFAFLVGAGTLALGIGWGRGGLTPAIGLTLRYVSLSVPLICELYIILVLYGGSPFGWTVRGLLALCAAAMWFPNTYIGLTYGPELRRKTEAFIADVQAGLPPLVLADRYTRHPYLIYPYKEALADNLKRLHQAGIGMFRDMHEDPPYRSLLLQEAELIGTNANQFELRESHFVYAIRLKYAYNPLGPFADFRLGWHPGGPDRPQAPQSPAQLLLPQDAKENSLVVWIDNAIDHFWITPDSKPCACRVWDIELLVPPDS